MQIITILSIEAGTATMVFSMKYQDKYEKKYVVHLSRKKWNYDNEGYAVILQPTQPKAIEAYHSLI
jgi:hypothetical protein